MVGISILISHTNVTVSKISGICIFQLCFLGQRIFFPFPNTSAEKRRFLSRFLDCIFNIERFSRDFCRFAAREILPVMFLSSDLRKLSNETAVFLRQVFPPATWTDSGATGCALILLGTWTSGRWNRLGRSSGSRGRS